MGRQIENRCWCTGAPVVRGRVILGWNHVASRNSLYFVFNVYLTYRGRGSRDFSSFVVLGKKDGVCAFG